MTERTTYAPGFYPDMPLEDYYADPSPGPCGSLNSSSIPYLRQRSPAHFATRSPVLVERLGLDPADDSSNAAMHRGRIIHRIALGKGEDYATLDFPDFRTDAAKKAREAAVAQGKSVMLLKDAAGVLKQADRLRGHLDELFMGLDWLPEVAAVWAEDTPWGPVNCRALIDAYCPDLNHGVDIKSTTDASVGQVTRRMEQGGYDIQAAWYSRGIQCALGLPPGKVQFSTLFAEGTPPYGSQSFQLSEAWWSSAWNECQLALRLFAQCQQADTWPGYPRRSRLLTPPGWMITRRMERELGGEAMDLDDEPDTSLPKKGPQS